MNVMNIILSLRQRFITMMSASFGMRGLEGLEGMKHVCHEKKHAKLHLYCKVVFFKMFSSEALVKLLVDISAFVFVKHLIISQSDQSYTF